MRQDLVAKFALGCLAITTCGCAAGIGLANYAQSGSFDFYRQARVAEWTPEPSPQVASVESTDLAFVSDYPADTTTSGSRTTLASFEP